MNKKRGQLHLSFGVIFSIVLIIIFLAFGFYAITKFIALQRTIEVQKFLQDFQEDVNKMWKGTQGSQELTYSLPKKISSVCFEEDEFQNLEFISKEIFDGDKIENLNIEERFCVENIEGKISFTIVKDYGETLVRITE